MLNLPHITKETNFLDIYSVNEYKLVVYTFGLVFGKPSLNQFKLTFEANQYLKITEYTLNEWFTFLQKVSKYLGLSEDERKDSVNSIRNPYIIVTYSEQEEETADVSTLSRYCVCSLRNENEEFELTFISKIDEIFEFTLKQHEFFSFLQGFCDLFFKMYCYPSEIYILIKQIVKNDSSLINKCNFNDIYNKLPNYANSSEKIYAIELIERHKDILISWNELFKLIS
jgi:hypothetical protein